MPYHSNDAWREFQSIFPAKTVLGVIAWAVLVLADIIVAAVVTFNLGILERFSMNLEILVLCLVAGGLYAVERLLLKIFQNLFL